MGRTAGMKPESLAEIVRRLRHAGQMSQAQLAESIGMSPGMIGLVETGKRSISVEAVDLIAQALDLSADDARDLRLARERASAEFATTRPAGAGVPLDMMASLLDEVRALAAEVAQLKARLASLESGASRRSK